MSPIPTRPPERILILAPRGRDALVAKAILHEAGVHSEICIDVKELLREIERGADLSIVTEEAVHNRDLVNLRHWIVAQPPWSDFPFIVLTRHGGGLERNPQAAQLVHELGNVSFLERPFHPTTLISVVHAGLRGRQRQYECQRLNEQLETRVQERTAELAAANRQLLAQIEEREKVEATLRQMQRLEAVGQLTSGVAHDFNNLLTVVIGNIEFVERELMAGRISRNLLRRVEAVQNAAERGARLTDQLLAFSRRQRLEPKGVDLNETIALMRDLVQSTIGGSIRVELKSERRLRTALVDPTQLELAILNLVINARDAMAGGGTLSVETANVQLGSPHAPEEPAAGEYAAISVADTGTGMPDAVRRKAFEPFFTTKEIGKGSGLGLSQVLGFAQQSGGGVRIESEPGRGTTVHLYLPCTKELPAAVPKRRGMRDAGQVKGAEILLVDDDEGVREITAEMLRDLGYVVHECGSGGAALDLLQSKPDVELILVDFAMPGMSGTDVVRHAHNMRPFLPTLFVTGFADRAALAGVSESHIVGKPFRQEELAEKVRLVLSEAATGNVVRLRR